MKMALKELLEKAGLLIMAGTIVVNCLVGVYRDHRDQYLLCLRVWP